MAEYAEDPFQMDEELPVYNESTLVTPTDRTPNDGENKDNQDKSKKMLITPRYTDPNIVIDSNIMQQDDELIRSKLNEFKMAQDDSTTLVSPAPTENEEKEEEVAYEEDLDDKFDENQKTKMEEDYKKYQESLRKPRLSINKDIILTPPENFAPVINQIYRSSFPQPTNFAFLTKLKLKSVLCLIPEEYPEIHTNFFQNEGIKLFQLGMSGNKEPFVKIPHDLITEAIKIVLDPKNQPILIHCNRGKHRTGCLVGVLRRLQKWSLTIIFDEYRKFAAPKERPMDQQFIELYDETELLNYAEENQLLPLKWNY
ncbi:hypothetical protein HYPBUDRAFT_110306 [Hyphopichia burtonii NRRL Y-1933]|uniref:diphosphoinositol-polyphosphate diphosphatase n=1 Tax=Hyphopichia burtonii NRRL Y-1933 TaxID=984485 RepID=A0A1E4RIY1_9ASCO|nr:hypothetical protein HYPBUDRAFT_110306 [Hyphopichia burtonii NRRL Y-1933]ODV67055.1 hypothetical protein HYPBUDRAFT_110306 [Hyphopichia burtonii NRRL Y-1933]